jgi:Surface-adhesin protein E
MKGRITALLAGVLLAGVATAQINTVPMRGLGNEWVKQLHLRGRMDWEWIETYPDRVYFATRHDARRQGDVVTMWMRIEYSDTQSPSSHKSALSRDDWDCQQKRRANVGTFFFRWNNLDDDDPEQATALLRNWEKIEPGTLGDTLLQFACSIQPAQQLVQPAGSMP